MVGKRTLISVYLDEETASKVRALAEMEGLKITQIIRGMVLRDLRRPPADRNQGDLIRERDRRAALIRGTSSAK
jgi:hypothetical protein